MKGNISHGMTRFFCFNGIIEKGNDNFPNVSDQR